MELNVAAHLQHTALTISVATTTDYIYSKLIANQSKILAKEATTKEKRKSTRTHPSIVIKTHIHESRSFAFRAIHAKIRLVSRGGALSSISHKTQTETNLFRSWITQSKNFKTASSSMKKLKRIKCNVKKPSNT